MCCKMAHMSNIFASTKQINLLNSIVMNTDNALAFLSSLTSSDASYRTLIEMIDDMGLEIIATQQL